MVCGGVSGAGGASALAFLLIFLGGVLGHRSLEGDARVSPSSPFTGDIPSDFGSLVCLAVVDAARVDGMIV